MISNEIRFPILLIYSLFKYELTVFWNWPVIRHSVLEVSPPLDLYLSCVISATILWSVLIWALRTVLTCLLSYHAWMYEPRGRMSLKTKVWLVSNTSNTRRSTLKTTRQSNKCIQSRAFTIKFLQQVQRKQFLFDFLWKIFEENNNSVHCFLHSMKKF